MQVFSSVRRRTKSWTLNSGRQSRQAGSTGLVNLARLHNSLRVRLADRLTGLPKRFNQFSKEVQPVLVNLTSLRNSLLVRLADSLPGLLGAVQPP
jgi:hypothetical protein